MKKVLVITYYWPPGSGAGVQRWLKFSKYLPETGWEPVILTVDPEYGQYPATDTTLTEDIRPGLEIHKTPATNYFRFVLSGKKGIPSAGFANREKRGVLDFILRFIRGNFFIPDPRKGWNRYAYRKAAEIISQQEIKILITSSPPHSTQLIGLRLKKKFPHLKWIADLRDPWTDIYYYSEFLHTPPARYFDRLYEKRVISSADRIITVGDALKQAFAAKVAGSEAKIYVVSNGYDEDDFKKVPPSTPSTFTVTYTGTISFLYPLDAFIKAAHEITESGADLKIRFAGLISGEQKESILTGMPSGSVEFISYVNHLEAVRLIAGSSALLLVIPGHDKNNCIITGKLFEYIASGKPVILIGPPDGDAAQILLNTGAGRVFTYTDSAGIRDFLMQLIRGEFKMSVTGKEKYSRKNLARELSHILAESVKIPTRG